MNTPYQSMQDMSKKIQGNMDDAVKEALSSHPEGLDMSGLLWAVGKADMPCHRQAYAQSVQRLEQRREVVKAAGLYRAIGRVA